MEMAPGNDSIISFLGLQWLKSFSAPVGRSALPWIIEIQHFYGTIMY